MRARDKDKYLNDDGDKDNEDEEDVMGLLFEVPTDGDFVFQPPSARGACGKRKDKNKMTVAGEDAKQIGTGIDARSSGRRIRRKSWRKALADDDDDDACEDTDVEADDAVVRPYSSNMSSNLLSSLTNTFCHHCRRKTLRPKMRCTRVRVSTGEQCRKMYCDLCIEKRYVPAPLPLILERNNADLPIVRYPSLTFDEFATSFSCPCCRNFCNCTHCARRRGEVYIPERQGGWRKWAALLPVTTGPTSGPTSPPRKNARQYVDGSTKLRRKGTAERPASMAEVLSEADDSTRVVPVQPAAGPLLPPQSPASHTLISTTTTAPTIRVVDKKSRRHEYIGKPLKSWGHLVSVPDAEDQQLGVALGRGTGRNGRKRKRAVRVRLFVGSKEPLLLNRSHEDKKRKTKGRKRKRKGREGNRRRQSATSLPISRTSSLVTRGEGVTNQNAALHDDPEPDLDPDPDDVNVDIDEGVWPEEYAHAHEHVREHDEYVAPPGGASGIVTMPPEDLERAIGVAFAAGMQWHCWQW